MEYNKFKSEGKKAVRRLRKGHLYTGEDIRIRLTKKGIVPHHHNMWGNFIRTLINEGVLEKTNEFVPTISKSSHGRITRLYEKV